VHELTLTRELVDLAVAHAGGRPVRRVVVEVGRLSGVVPEAVRFCFEVVRAGTPLAGAELELLEPEGRARCRACGGEATLESTFAACPCGSRDLEWLGGDGLLLKELEVERV